MAYVVVGMYLWCTATVLSAIVSDDVGLRVLGKYVVAALMWPVLPIVSLVLLAKGKQR